METMEEVFERVASIEVYSYDRRPHSMLAQAQQYLLELIQAASRAGKKPTRVTPQYISGLTGVLSSIRSALGNKMLESELDELDTMIHYVGRIDPMTEGHRLLSFLPTYKSWVREWASKY